MHSRLRTLFAATTTALAVVLLHACVRPTPASKAPARDQLYVNFVGTWKGTLEVADGLGTGTRVTRPAALQVVPAPDQDGLELRYSSDLSGTSLPHVDHVHFDRTMTDAVWGDAGATAPQAFAVRSSEGGRNGDALRLVLEGEEHNGDEPTMIRETLELSPAEIRLVQEARPIGGDFAFRRAYVLRRAQ
ncbi:hypothetical protein [Gemmatimonas sp.]|uniref:hypothetical protein n=1 Tax=Gemmatimonas sp. TaxID=1962908 RepID=UPI00286A0EDB|nr:hypothetical protein [Gemmatimonas sp.]